MFYTGKNTGLTMDYKYTKMLQKYPRTQTNYTLSQLSVYCVNVSSFKTFLSSFYSVTAIAEYLCLY